MKERPEERIAAVKQILGPDYEAFRFVDPTQAAAATARRDALLAALGESLSYSFGGTKPHTGPLSPGCRRCGQGRWSCLFFDLFCNADCFFCPGQGYHDASRRDGAPEADGLRFERAEDFADYVARFDVTGVSYSGGDPLLSLERVLRYQHALRARPGATAYTWLYTNGLAATSEHLAALRDAGLDEIRFNIAATDYTLDHLARAVGVIDRVTVEIPVVPEEIDRLRGLLGELDRLGVDHLNLHQLFVVGGNRAALLERGYTFVHDPTPGVLASELGALELMVHGHQRGLALPIQLCATCYKGRYVGPASEVRVAQLLRRGWEGQTEWGLVRRAWLEGDPAALAVCARALEGRDPERRRWHWEADAAAQLWLDSDLLSVVPSEPSVALRVAYLKPNLGLQDPSDYSRELPDYHDIELNDHTTFGAVLIPASPVLEVAPADVPAFVALARGDEDATGCKSLAVIERFEQVPRGLSDYV